MTEVVSYGLLVAALIFVVNGVRWRRGGGIPLILMGIAFAVVGASGLIGPKFAPVAIATFVGAVVGLAARYYSWSAEVRAGVRVSSRWPSQCLP